MKSGDDDIYKFYFLRDKGYFCGIRVVRVVIHIFPPHRRGEV